MGMGMCVCIGGGLGSESRVCGPARRPDDVRHFQQLPAAH